MYLQKKSTDIMSFCNSFITISTYTTIQKYHKTTALFCLLFLLFYSDRYWIHLLQNYDKNVWYTLMLTLCKNRGGVSSVPFPFWFPFQLHCELVSSLLALDATELVSQPLTQTAVEMINIYVISVLQKRWVQKLNSFSCNSHDKKCFKWCWNDAGILLN